ncbi:MAG: DUF4097 domain-containing protein [Bacteroidia bacterium]|nr:DUF4097 domain-containing protein [Bacteroidia bacterium]
MATALYEETLLVESWAAKDFKRLTTMTQSGNYRVTRSNQPGKIFITVRLQLPSIKKKETFQQETQVSLQTIHGEISLLQAASKEIGTLFYEIQIPDQFPLHLKTSDSIVIIENLTGNPIEINHQSKLIQLKSIQSKDISVRTGSGTILVENCTGNLVAEGTGNMDIELWDGSLEAICRKGTLTFRTKSVFEVKLVNQSGDIKLFLPKKAPYQFDLFASRSLFLELEKIQFKGLISKQKMEGKNHNGTVLLKATAQAGDIYLIGCI